MVALCSTERQKSLRRAKSQTAATACSRCCKTVCGGGTTLNLTTALSVVNLGPARLGRAPEGEGVLRSIKTGEAAALLSVSPSTLRLWERKYGYPRPLRSPGRHRSYAYAEIAALRDALRAGVSVDSAMSRVREGFGSDSDMLFGALESFSIAGADHVMEASVAIRSLERSVDEVLLPAVDQVRQEYGASSTRWATAQRWAVDWLSRASRLTSPPEQHGLGVLIGDASGGPLGAAGPAVHAITLYCRIDGIPVLVLPVEARIDISDALDAATPCCALIVGGQSSDNEVARWAYGVLKWAKGTRIALYRRPVRTSSRQPTAEILSGTPQDAYRQVRAIVDQARAESADSAAKMSAFAHVR